MAETYEQMVLELDADDEANPFANDLADTVMDDVEDEAKEQEIVRRYMATVEDEDRVIAEAAVEYEADLVLAEVEDTGNTEFNAISIIDQVLLQLTLPQRRRVLRYTVDRHAIALSSTEAD